VLRKKARETDDGRTTDRPSLLFGHSVSPRTGTSLTVSLDPSGNKRVLGVSLSAFVAD
jgi:hypothetical protein